MSRVVRYLKHPRVQINPASKESKYHGGGGQGGAPNPNSVPKREKSDFGWGHCPSWGAGSHMGATARCQGTRVRGKSLGLAECKTGPSPKRRFPKWASSGRPDPASHPSKVVGIGIVGEVRGGMGGLGNKLRTGWGRQEGTQADPVSSPRLFLLINTAACLRGLMAALVGTVRPHWLRREPL